MSIAYLDSSVIVGHAFNERGASAMFRRLRNFDEVVSSPLLEAELLAALRREDRALDERWLVGLGLAQVGRSLRSEIAMVLGVGYLRGADCWHLATALYLVSDPADITFLTLDQRQKQVAQRLGFKV